MGNERHIAAWATGITEVPSHHVGSGQETICNPFGDDFPVVEGDRVINPHTNTHEAAATPVPEERQREVGVTGVMAATVAETPPKTQQEWDNASRTHEVASQYAGGIGYA